MGERRGKQKQSQSSREGVIKKVALKKEGERRSKKTAVSKKEKGDEEVGIVFANRESRRENMEGPLVEEGREMANTHGGGKKKRYDKKKTEERSTQLNPRKAKS